MIARSFFCLLALSAIYSLVIAGFPEWSGSQNQKQDNYIKVGKYLYGDPVGRPVAVVGTSLSARLVTDSLPEFSDLTFGGMSVLEGLAIVEHRQTKPALLLLETNLYYKEGDANFLSPLFNPINYFLKEHLASFRADKQPVSLLTKGTIGLLKSRKNNAAAETIEKKDVPFQESAFAEQRRDYAQLPDTADASRRLADLKKQVTALQQRGVEVAFVEMPINAELVNSIRQQYARRTFRAALPLCARQKLEFSNDRRAAHEPVGSFTIHFVPSGLV